MTLIHPSRDYVFVLVWLPSTNFKKWWK